MRAPHLRDQLAHVRAAAGGRLVGHRGDPLDQTGAKQAGGGHQHQADGAVAADEALDPVGQRLVDDRAIRRVEHDRGVVGHAQRGSGIDPVAGPPTLAESRVDLVVYHTRTEMRSRAGEPPEIVGILYRRGGFAYAGAAFSLGVEKKTGLASKSRSSSILRTRTSRPCRANMSLVLTDDFTASRPGCIAGPELTEPRDVALILADVPQTGHRPSPSSRPASICDRRPCR